MLALNLHRAKQHRQAGRCHHGGIREPLSRKNLGFTGGHMRGAGEDARGIKCLQCFEIDQFVHQATQRIDIQRVGLIGRELW